MVGSEVGSISKGWGHRAGKTVVSPSTWDISIDSLMAVGSHTGDSRDF